MSPNMHKPANAASDIQIGRVLHALGSAHPAPGLEQRIATGLAARRADAALEAPTASPIFARLLNAVKASGASMAPAPLYALAVASLATVAGICIFTLHNHRSATERASASVAQPQVSLRSAGTSLRPIVKTDAATSVPIAASFEGAGVQSRHVLRLRNAALAAEAASTQRPSGQDAIALAETLAPSRTAPQMPLTGQERLMIAATRKGQPIEVAALDIAREPAFRAAADAREKAGIQRLARGLFAPLALAERLESTASQPQHDERPAATSEPFAFSSNETQTTGAIQ